MPKVTVDQIRHRLQTSDQWMMVGMLTIFNLQTEEEKNVEQTRVSNGVGFNGPDSRTLTKCSTWLLQKASMRELRNLPTVRLETFFTAPWAVDAIRKKMPKYAGQLTAIANAKQRLTAAL